MTIQTGFQMSNIGVEAHGLQNLKVIHWNHRMKRFTQKQGRKS